MQKKPSEIFSPEQMSLRKLYLKTFEKHHMTIDEFETQVYRFRKFSKYSGIPAEFAKQSFDNMIPDPEQQLYIDKAKSFLKSPFSFCLISSPASGNGKSRLAANLTREFYYTYRVAPDRVWIHDAYYPSAYFMASTEYIRLVQLFRGFNFSPIDLNWKLSELDFLVIDDVFIALMMENKDVLSYMYDLMDMCILGRSKNKFFKMLITSNLKAEQIGELDNRLDSRLRKRNVLIIKMDNYTKDWRDWKLIESEK